MNTDTEQLNMAVTWFLEMGNIETTDIADKLKYQKPLKAIARRLIAEGYDCHDWWLDDIAWEGIDSSTSNPDFVVILADKSANDKNYEKANKIGFHVTSNELYYFAIPLAVGEELLYEVNVVKEALLYTKDLNKKSKISEMKIKAAKKRREALLIAFDRFVKTNDDIPESKLIKRYKEIRTNVRKDQILLTKIESKERESGFLRRLLILKQIKKIDTETLKKMLAGKPQKIPVKGLREPFPIVLSEFSEIKPNEADLTLESDSRWLNSIFVTFATRKELLMREILLENKK